MIAVVGSQSAGKSSVLENIVGRSFLPRGNGIVTRCPCEIRMHATESEEYGMFKGSNEPDRKYFDFNDIRLKIESETDRLAGKKGLTVDAILLDIYSPNVLDLTLVDLPGAVRTVAEGQDLDTPAKIQQMILRYIAQPNCIILAVSAANNDLAVSDAIALSQQVDPKGERTIGVLTKLDLMDEGTNARRIITGEDDSAPKLKLGYIGVVNRSQKDIIDHRSITDAREKEAQYFASEPAYRSLFARMGTQHLVTRCSEQLVQAIQRELPTISKKLNALIHQKKQELRALPDTQPATLRSMMTEVIHAFIEEFNGLIDGLKKSAGFEDTSELVGGARIEALFSSVFRQEIFDLYVFSGGDASMAEDNIRILMKNTKGLGGGLFMDNAALDKMIANQIERFRDPSIKCARMVFEEMSKLQSKAIDQVAVLGAFPKARLAIIEVVTRVLSGQHEKTVDHLNTFVEMNCHRINYDHPDFDSVRVMHEVELRRFGDEENEEEKTLVLKAHSGQELTSEEKAKVRGIMERRQRASQGQQPRAADGGTVSSHFQGGMSAPPTNNTTVGAGLGAGSLVRQTSKDVESQRLHHFLKTISPKEQTQVEQVVALTDAYFALSKKAVVDQVPKYIQLLLVEHTQKKVAKEVMMLVSDANVEELMSPSDDVKIRREETQAALEKLQEAHEMLFEVSRAASTGL
mmetsp:Transcript_71963/g.203998  ORF Transcript_71963/g.203998 Transcript_71963/m.203998 type:complete len:689 (+) Transcript_71963:374-2440(+)